MGNDCYVRSAAVHYVVNELRLPFDKLCHVAVPGRLRPLNSWSPESRIEQCGEPRACDCGLNVSDLDRLLLIGVRQTEWPVSVADRRRVGKDLGGSLALCRRTRMLCRAGLRSR
jgi:hypothetical protein